MKSCYLQIRDHSVTAESVDRLANSGDDQQDASLLPRICVNIPSIRDIAPCHSHGRSATVARLDFPSPSRPQARLVWINVKQIFRIALDLLQGYNLHLNLRGTAVNYLITRLIKRHRRNYASELVLFEASACDKPRGFFLHLYTRSMLIHCQRDECFHVKCPPCFHPRMSNWSFFSFGEIKYQKDLTKHSTCGSSFPCWFGTLTAVLVQMCESWVQSRWVTQALSSDKKVNAEKERRLTHCSLRGVLKHKPSVPVINTKAYLEGTRLNIEHHRHTWSRGLKQCEAAHKFHKEQNCLSATDQLVFMGS